MPAKAVHERAKILKTYGFKEMDKQKMANQQDIVVGDSREGSI